MLRSISRPGRWPLALMLVGLGACADEPSAPRIPSPSRPNANLGDVITVTNTSGGTGQGSLRWAVAQVAGGEIIRFAPALAGATIVVDSTIPVLHPITIEGPADKGVTISGGNATHIFEVYMLPSATTFRNLALVNGEGNGSAGGGAIVATSDIVLENVTLSNHTGSDWAAFYTTENATFINTTISSNNTTTPGRYGAAFVAKKLTLVNSTIAYNNNGGVDVRGPLAMRNSIITHNGAGPNCSYVPSFERAGRNLADDTSCGDSTVMLIAPAKLDSLRNNGGPGKTHALTGASPAINAGKDCTVTVDQRYVPRDASCDLGAFEFKDFTTVTITNNTSLPVDPTTGLVFVAGSVTCSSNETFDLAVEVTQEQKAGRGSSVVKAAGTVTVTCSKTAAQPWGVALAPSSGEFGIGSAVVTTKTAAPPYIIPATVSTPIKLYRGRK
jgi:hypothetical protein